MTEEFLGVAGTTTSSGDASPADLTAYHWSPQPGAAQLVRSLLEECLRDSPFAASLSKQMLDKTGTRLFDWVDHFGLPADHSAVAQLSEVGYEAVAQQGAAVWEHRQGLLPRIRVGAGPSRALAIKVESVVDFLVAFRFTGLEILGEPSASVRMVKMTDENLVEVWMIERHGSRAFEANPQEIVPLAALLHHSEAFRLRCRGFETDAEGFAHARSLIDAAIADLGRDRTCELFFGAEREYWFRRNRAGQVQKTRQDSLGLGWANHDHHTYRSSRHCFAELIAFLEHLGFVCRERFYAGREAGWGAQVIEHPVTGVTIFADVDLSPEELSHDFAHDPLPPRDALGTVGLWCALHGEAFLQAGMHHLECQFDFSATRDQLQLVGIETMPPFTDYPYLKQAFTKGEIWSVNPARVELLSQTKRISAEQAQQFLTHGALGSHLEILQRNDGYKGFNQAGINQIISATDPRHQRGASLDGYLGVLLLWLVATLASGSFAAAQSATDMIEIKGPAIEEGTTGNAAQSPPVRIVDFMPLFYELNMSTDDVNDEMAPRGLCAKTVRGQLLNADGRAISNAKVVLIRSKSRSSELYRDNFAMTDDSGKFVVRGEPEMCTLAIEASELAWSINLTAQQSEIVVQFPRMLDVSLKLDRDVELEEGNVQLLPLDAFEGGLCLLRKLKGTFDESGSANINSPAGRYLASGNKCLNPGKPPLIWNWCVIGEVTVESNPTPETRVRRFNGSRISGQIQLAQQKLKQFECDYIQVDVSVNIERNGVWEEQVFDSVLCESDGRFRAGAVPFGRAMVQVKVVYLPNVNRQFRGQSALFQHRLSLAKRLEVVELPMANGVRSLSQKVGSVLDRPRNAESPLAGTNDQIASLLKIADQEVVIQELLRLLHDPQTPDYRLSVVVEILGQLKPVSSEVKSALLNRARTANLSQRQLILEGLGKLQADPNELIVEIAKFAEAPEFPIRFGAIRALGDLSANLPQESAIVNSAFIAALEDPVISMRMISVGMIGTRKLASALPPLRAHLRTDPCGSVRAKCAWAIYQMTDEVEEPLRALIEVLQGDDLSAKLEAATALGNFDSRAQSAIPQLESNNRFPYQPPFRKSRDMTRYQLATAAQKAIRKIQGAGKRDQTNE